MKKLCIWILWGMLAGSTAAQIPFSRGADGDWSDLSKWRANYGSGWGAAGVQEIGAAPVSSEFETVTNIISSGTAEFARLKVEAGE